MEELTKAEVDWKKVTVIGLLIFLAVLVSTGATWYVMDATKNAEIDVKDEMIASLDTRISELEEEINEQQSASGTEEKAPQATKILNFELTLPTGWTKKVVEDRGTSTVTLTGPFTITLLANNAGTDAGMASIQKKYEVSVANKQLSLTGPETLTMSDLATKSYSLTTSSFSFGGNYYYAYSYLETQTDQAKYASTFEQILESLTFN